MHNNKRQSESSNNQDISNIFNEYQLPLKGYIAKRGLSKEDCEDILQNVFYQLSKIDLKENPIDQISGWLYAVARNQIIDRSRKHKEEELPYFTDENGETSFIKEITTVLLDSNSPETEYIRSLVWEELEVALAELPDNQRNIFELTELEGFSFKEISESTGITVNTLISRKRYAVLHLRERLYGLYMDLLGD